MNTTLCEAINQGELIEFEYEGLVRIVEPYIYGSNENGEPLLKGFQTGGFNKKNDNSYTWDVYQVEKMGSVQFVGKGFSHERAGYEKNDPLFTTIYCQR